MVIDLRRPSNIREARKLIEERFGPARCPHQQCGHRRAGGAFKAPRRTSPSKHYAGPLKRISSAWVDLTQRLLPLLQRSEHPRIVNQSSILASLTEHSDPTASSPMSTHLLTTLSKTAVNAFTVHLAKILRDSSIKVNSAHPGSVKTDMNPMGDLSVEDGARTAVTLAILGDDGPSGGFFYDGKTRPR